MQRSLGGSTAGRAGRRKAASLPGKEGVGIISEAASSDEGRHH